MVVVRWGRGGGMVCVDKRFIYFLVLRVGMKEMDVGLNLRVPASLREGFRKKCVDVGVVPSFKIRCLMEEFLDGERTEDICVGH